MTKILKPQKTLLIGLGGSGIKTVTLVKQYLSCFYDLKLTDFFEFLFIDCVDPVEDITTIAPETLDRNEVIKIGTDITDDLINNPYISKRLDSHFYKFHATDNTVNNTRDGAGTTRIYSLISLFKHANFIHDKIRSRYNELIAANKVRLSQYADKAGYKLIRQDNEIPNILIFASITGGTGAGTFIDTAALTRSATNVAGNRPNIFGFFYLPDVFLDPVNDPYPTELSTDQKTYIQANGYAALKEMEFFLNNNPFSCQYNTDLVVNIKNQRQEKDKLFDKVFLFNRFINSEDRAAENSFEVFKSTAESVLHLTTSEIATYLPHRMIDNQLGAKYFTGPLGHSLLENQDNGTRRMHFSSFGVYTLEIPQTEIKQLFKLKAIENFLKSSQDSLLTEEQVLKEVRNETLNNRDDLIGRLGILNHKKREERVQRKRIQEKPLYKLLRKKAMAISMPSVETDAYRMLEDVSNLSEWEIDREGNAFSKSIEQAKKTIKNFSDQFKHDLDSDATKKLKGFYGVNKEDYNLSLNQLLLDIINSKNTKLNICHTEKALSIILDEVNDINRFLTDLENQDNRELRSVGREITNLVNEIEKNSNFLSFLSPGISLGKFDDIKENMDIAKGAYKEKIQAIVQLIRHNQQILIDRELVSVLRDLMQFISEKINDMLRGSDSPWRQIQTANKKLSKELKNELEKARVLIQSSEVKNQPLTERFAPTGSDIDELFEQGLLNLNSKRILSYLHENNISLSNLFTEAKWNLNAILMELNPILEKEYKRLHEVIDFDDDEFFDFSNIQQMQNILKERSLPGLKFKVSNLDNKVYTFMLNPTSDDDWNLPGFRSFKSNNKYKYTLLQVADGIPAITIFNINKWHDIYSDLMRRRTFDDKSGGDKNVRPLHIFKTTIPFESFIHDSILELNRFKNSLDTFAERVFEEALRYDVVQKHNSQYIYRGVIDFGPSTKEAFIQRMRDNFSFLWDLSEAIYDVKKFSGEVSQVTADWNKKMLEEARKEEELKKKIDDKLENISDPDLKELAKKVKEYL